MATLADALTASRLLLAVAVGAALTGEHYRATSMLLVVAWATDYLDGLLARAARRPTKLGDWDFRVDVTLGIAILTGLAVAGVAPLWLVIAAVIVGAGSTLGTGNPAPAMLLMALAYGLLLALLLAERPELWWLPFVAIGLLLVLDWKRFLRTILPAFFNGMANLSSRGEEAGPPVLDDWA